MDQWLIAFADARARDTREFQDEIDFLPKKNEDIFMLYFESGNASVRDAISNFCKIMFDVRNKKGWIAKKLL